MPRKIPIAHSIPRPALIWPQQLLRLNGTPALLPHRIIRHYAAPPQKKSPTNAKKPPQRSSFIQYNQNDADKYSLKEAVRYLRAFEVGQDAIRTKYELAVKLFAMKNGPTIKHRVKLPVPVKTDARVCVIAEGKAKEDALKAGAEVAGTTEVFELLKSGPIKFTHLIAHEPSYPLLLKARMGPILGPRGLMPSPKTGTVVANPAAVIDELTAKSDYRERLGVIRAAIGQLGFTEQQLAKNIRAFMDSVKREIAIVQGQTEKYIVEVVLSSTRGPGFILDGRIESQEPPQPPKAEPTPAVQ